MCRRSSLLTAEGVEGKEVSEEPNHGWSSINCSILSELLSSAPSPPSRHFPSSACCMVGLRDTPYSRSVIAFFSRCPLVRELRSTRSCDFLNRGGGFIEGILRGVRCTKSLKVRKIENFFGSDFEFCVIPLLVMLKY
jgi:hypothetical protein